ncbi:MAG: DUF5666 domain-containing protein [Myxococcota bacterium]
MTASFRRNLSAALIAALLFCVAVCGCAPGGEGSVADNGGMSGTGISQGAVNSFGSIFVNGIEWDIDSATITLDGVPANEADLRLGMVVRVNGDFTTTGTTGTATSVSFDYTLEGPIESAPVDVGPTGIEKSFTTLDQTVIMNSETTAFDGGASFLGLAEDDVVQISGFVDDLGAIRATRILLLGAFPALSDAGLQGIVSNIDTNPDGSGDFNIGTLLVHYDAGTTFTEITREDLANGDRIVAHGILRITGTDLDATEIRPETLGLGSGDAEEAEIEGIVSNFVSNSSFQVSGTPIDASAATFDPPGFIVMNGFEVEVEGSLVNGVLIADRVESEGVSDNVRIEAAVSSINSAARELTVLGVTVIVDGDVRIEDDRDDLDNFGFDDIQVDDFLEIRGVQTGPTTILALRIERIEDEDDLFLEGPVTALDINAPSLSIMGQSIPIVSGTLYFDDLDQARTEEEFFRTPGDVMLGDLVKATDEDAANLRVLGVADEVELE